MASKAKYYVCGHCGLTSSAKTTVEDNFYISYSIYFKYLGRAPLCKDCVLKLSLDNNERFNLVKFKEVLYRLDKPFLTNIYESAREKATNKNTSIVDDVKIIKQYMRIIVMPQYISMTWKDGEDKIGQTIVVEDSDEEKNTAGKDSNAFKEETSNSQNISKQKLLQLREKYGYGYSNDEYLDFERKYKKITHGYKEKTALHTERLLTYIIHKVKEERASAAGNVSEAEKWAKMAQKDAQDAKINVSQLSKSDITGGVDLVPQLAEALEEKASLISIMPKLKAQPYDDADVIIWATINKYRRIEDKPAIEYREIWDFYDEMLVESFKQKGYTEEQIKEEKERRIVPFRDLGKVYVEPLYGDEGFNLTEEGDEDVIME